MTKLNRRDYLIGMGAVAGTIAAGQLEISASSPQRRTRRIRAQKSKIYVESGPRQFDLLTTESVKLVFTGLMALWPTQAGECVVGFHSQPSGKHRHELTIRIFRKERGSCPTTPLAEIPVAAQTPLSLVVTEPDLLTRVLFFQPQLQADGSKHDNDFRWVPNLEGSHWYGQELTRKQGVYSPTLVVPHGLFYTLAKTASTFRRQKPEGEGVLEVGSIADYVGTNIYLKPNGRVELKIGADTKVFEAATNVKHEVHFVNHCFDKASPGRHCQDTFKPFHLTDKTQRNDFYMNFEALDGIAPESELHLVIQRSGNPTKPDICGTGGRATDEAPCAAVGFGGTNGGGFPQFP